MEIFGNIGQNFGKKNIEKKKLIKTYKNTGKNSQKKEKHDKTNNKNTLELFFWKKNNTSMINFVKVCINIICPNKKYEFWKYISNVNIKLNFLKLVFKENNICIKNY